MCDSMATTLHRYKGGLHIPHMHLQSVETFLLPQPFSETNKELLHICMCKVITLKCRDKLNVVQHLSQANNKL